MSRFGLGAQRSALSLAESFHRPARIPAAGDLRQQCAALNENYHFPPGPLDKDDDPQTAHSAGGAAHAAGKSVHDVPHDYRKSERDRKRSHNWQQGHIDAQKASAANKKFNHERKHGPPV